MSQSKSPAPESNDHPPWFAATYKITYPDQLKGRITNTSSGQNEFVLWGNWDNISPTKILHYLKSIKVTLTDVAFYDDASNTGCEYDKANDKLIPTKR